MDGIGEGPKQPNLISLDRSGNSRTCPARILAAESLDGSLSRRQSLPLKMAVHWKEE